MIKKRISLCLAAAIMLCGNTTAQEQYTSHSSMYLGTSSQDAVKVPFSSVGAGTPTPIKWGMDTAWDDEGNVLRGINFIGKDNLTYGRISFQVMDTLNADGTLSERQLKFLNSRIQHIKLSEPDGVMLNSDPVDINVEEYTHHPERWHKVIKATTKYIEEHGLDVVSIGPFNEPDITASNQGSMEDFKAVSKLICEDPFFEGIRIVAGNTCNNDGAKEWYDYMKPYVSEGNTHQLAGDFDHYADFYTHVKADGNIATNDELHNVMEGIVGAQYGMENGIWWGTVGPTRGDFCVATSPGGARLGYGENRPAWSGAAVYRMPDGGIKAFAGVSERQASACSYEYVSRDKAVYFDGHGPAYTYQVNLPGGYRYGDKYQQSAEQTVQICQGEDVPLCPLTEGSYIIMNKKSQKVLTILSGGTSNGAAVVQSTNKGEPYQQWTLEALRDNGGDLRGYYVHSLRNANMNMETGGFQVKVGGTVSVWPVTKLENQRWDFVYAGDGYYKIRNYQSGLYLEVNNKSNNNNVAIRLCAEANEDHQLWRFLPIDAECEQEAPAVPTGLEATPQSHSVALDWDANTHDKDLNGYIVLRGEMDDSGVVQYDVIGRNVLTNHFIDNDCRENTTYYYAIQCADYSQNRSPKCEPVTASVSGTSALVARYEFEQTAADLTENRLDGVLGCSEGFAPGRSGRYALQFDGTDNYLSIAPAAVNLQQVTIAAWVYNPGTIAAESRLLDLWSDDTHYAHLALNHNKSICLTLREGDHTYTLDAGTLAEGWHHVALTMDDEAIALYVDAEERGRDTSIPVRLSDIRPVCNYVGRAHTQGLPLMNGAIDDLRIYNYALARADIAQLMSEAGSVPESESNWPMPVAPGKALGSITSTEAIYLYNVNADAFVTYGMDWNTQAVAQRLAKGDCSVDGRFRVKVTKVGSSKVRISMYDKSNVYIGCLADANNVWTDRSATEGTFTYQEISTPEGTQYQLISESQKAPLDVSYAYGGPLTTRHGRGFTQWAFVSTKDISTTKAYAKYKERKRLYAIRQAIVAAQQEDYYASDIEQASKVYLDPQATVDELRNAARQLFIAAASCMHDMDATMLFVNADMLGNNTTADWTEATTTIRDGDILMNHKTFTLTQTQTDLPTGIYDVVFHGFYRNDGSDAAPYVTATAANTVKGNMVTRASVVDNEVMMVTAENTAGAAQTLTSDKAQTVLKGIVVDNHTMTLTVTVKSSTQWVNFQGFTLVYRQPLVTVEVPQSGFTTFYYSDQSFLLPEGMEAYTIRQTTKGLQQGQHISIAGTVLTAGQAVVLRANPGVYEMVPTTKTKAADTRNRLRGSDEAELTRGGKCYYRLSETDNGELCWRWEEVDGGAFVNPAHKAYLASSKTEMPDEVLLEDIISAIRPITTDDDKSTEAIYNLAGQRVDESHPSIVIQNGKKVWQR